MGTQEESSRSRKSSHKLSDKLKELHNLRDQYVHGGQLIQPNFLDDAYLRIAILLKLFVSVETRVSLLELFEQIQGEELVYSSVDVAPYTCSVTMNFNDQQKE
jgi:hypothetical protein